MKLEKFRVEGFRCLESVDWVPIRKMIIFTGQNDGGKTSMLESMAYFLNPKSEPDPTDYTLVSEDGRRKDRIVTEGLFTVNESDKGSLGVTTNTLHLKREFYTSGTPRYLYKTSVPKDSRLHNLPKMNMDELTSLADALGVHLTNRRLKGIVLEEMKRWVAEQAHEDGWADLPPEAQDRLPELRIFASAGALDPEKEINATLRNSFSTRIKSSEYAGPLVDISRKIESGMKHDLDSLLPIIERYCPDVTDVQIRPTFDFSSGFKASTMSLVKRDGPAVDMSKEGEGRKRRITLAVYEWREKIFSEAPKDVPSEQLIIAFDEPDTHLDYLYQRKVFDLIKKISAQPRISVVVCTHSLNLIDRIPFTDVVHFEVVKGRTRTNVLETDDPELLDLFMFQISENLGLRNSVMLNERCFLAVEGLTEMTAIPVLFRLRFGVPPQAAGVRLLDGEGGPGARLFAKFLHKNRRSVIFLVDTDTKERSRGRYFTQEALKHDNFDPSQIFLIGKVEFEDAFSDDQYLRAAQLYWKRHDGSTWAVEEFRSLRDSKDFADDLVALVRGKTHTHIGKKEIGYDLSRSLKKPSEIPAEILRCLEHAYSLANPEGQE